MNEMKYRSLTDKEIEMLFTFVDGIEPECRRRNIFDAAESVLVVINDECSGRIINRIVDVMKLHYDSAIRDARAKLNELR